LPRVKLAPLTLLALPALPALLILVACQRRAPDAPAAPDLAPAAERYVRLVLAVGQHDADTVDAYYGPPAWRTEAEQAKRPLASIATDAAELASALDAVTLAADVEEIVQLRLAYLRRQLGALRARVEMLEGKKLSFDEESKALYDAVSPRQETATLDAVLADVDGLVPPGAGSLAERWERFRGGLAIPKDRLDAVFGAAIDECRARSAPHLALPVEETFTLEYVTGKSWSGYNWYQGASKSLIQLNTDLPMFIDRAIDLACHEGYPGHHAYNALLEKHLVRERGWVEFSVYPLFSPQSLIAEGTANFGIEVAFPGEEKTRFEAERLYPLAGLDPALAPTYNAVLAKLERLSYAGNEAARRYLEGEIDAATAADWLVRYTLSERPRAEQRVRFFDQYRSYVINYNLGKDLVRRHIERRGGTAERPAERWREFVALISSPRLPGQLDGERPR
jgi:hypothetical protein